MKFLKGLIYTMVVVFASAVMAQETTQAVKEEKPLIDISGVAYLEWNKELKNATVKTDHVQNAIDLANGSTAPVLKEPEHKNTFQINRVYLNFQKKFNDVWSARVTTDVGQVESKSSKKYTETGTTTSNVESTTNAYALYIKYAYIEAKQKVDFIDVKCQFGMIGTPLIGLIDKQSDYRWIEQNYIDQSKNILLYRQGNLSTYPKYTWKAESIDHSADLGAGVDVSLFKVVKLSGSIVNGEGYKKVNEGTLGDDGKAYYGMVTITPIKGVDIFGAIRKECTDDADKNYNYKKYKAVGASVSFDIIKIGAVYAVPKVESRTLTNGIATSFYEDSKYREDEYTLLDTWLLANLESVINVPILITGRYAIGQNKDVKDSKVTVMSGGLGYKFNENVRALAYYQKLRGQMYRNSETTFYAKTEVKF